MPIFIDGHSLNGLTPDRLKKLGNLLPDNYGITHLQLFYNKKEDKLYCILDAPNEEAIWKHHEREGLKCEFITQVQQIKTDKAIITEKMKVLGEMSSRVSHDLRTPISIIKNSLEIMNLRWSGEMEPEMAEYLAKINRAITSINAIIDDIVNFAKTSPLVLGKGHLVPIIRGVVDSLHVPDNIEITIPQKDVLFEFDSTKIEVLFNNLITNSIHAIGNSKGRITIEIGEAEAGKVRITVKDSGPGIPEELLPRIFEPLFTTKQHGTGLGLPSCKNITEQHGGTIAVTNNPTTVIINLPKVHARMEKVDPEIKQ